MRHWRVSYSYAAGLQAVGGCRHARVWRGAWGPCMQEAVQMRCARKDNGVYSSRYNVHYRIKRRCSLGMSMGIAFKGTSVPFVSMEFNL